jgi:hypothetical protein
MAVALTSGAAIELAVTKAGMPPAGEIEHFYFSALETSAAGVIIVDCKGAMLHINPAARQLLRRPQAKAGEPFYSLFVTDKSFDGIVDVVFFGLSAPQPVYADAVTLHLGHELVQLDVKVSKFRDHAGALQGVVVVINDVTHQHLRATFASIFAGAVAVVFLYVSLLGFFTHLIDTSNNRGLLDALLMLLPTGGALYIMAQCGLPMKMLGLSWMNWRQHAREAIVYSLLICVGLTLLMSVLHRLVPAVSDIPVIRMSWSSLTSLPFALWVPLYTALTPLQEFLARGALQAPLQQVFAGRYRYLQANIVANLMFSVFHEHLGLAFSLMVLVPGLFWGWLFSRQKTLVGVSISHAIVGTYALYFLNVHAYVNLLF